ncbi:MAG: TrbI/VirB10 family protein [Pseudomonadota bacterium]
MGDPTLHGLDRDDPRPPPGGPAAGRGGEAALRPVVAGRAPGAGLWLAVGGAVLMGVLVLLFLISRRSHADHDVQAASTAPAAITAPPPPPELALAEAAGRAPAFAAGPQPLPTVAPAPAPLPIIAGAAPFLAPAGSLAAEIAQRRRAPSLVVDLADGGGAAAPAGGGAASAAAAGPGGASGAAAKLGANPLSGDEQFAERIGAAEPDHAAATTLRNPRSVVPQGTMIPAVLETAMNSDLPGFVRAVVSRDVRGFDATSVLIPRGSRLVGQYRSGLSQGASRIFVIWTRVLRPDGASVQIGSPGGDPLGRAGQEGKLHSHFFRQFATSILLSVINAEVSNLAAQPTTQIIIGGTATGVASSAAPVTPVAGGSTTPTAPTYPPTITVLQGAPISIFVARDLDFSTVKELPK